MLLNILSEANNTKIGKIANNSNLAKMKEIGVVIIIKNKVANVMIMKA